MNTKWKCTQCGWSGMSWEVLYIYKNPNDMNCFCPECESTVRLEIVDEFKFSRGKKYHKKR